MDAAVLQDVSGIASVKHSRLRRANLEREGTLDAITERSLFRTEIISEASNSEKSSEIIP